MSNEKIVLGKGEPEQDAISSSAKLTQDDISNAKLIGALMVLAKTVEPLLLNGRKTPLDPDALRVCMDRVQALIYSTLSAFPEPGMLERETIAMARRMGLIVEQQIVPAGAKRRQ